MKKVTALFLAVVMTFVMTLGSAGVVLADDAIKININGSAKTFDQMPIMESARVLVPMRGIFEALGASVSWDEKTETVTGVKGDTKVVLQIGNTNATVDGKAVELDVPARLVNSRTLVPVRFISESLGATVNWDDATQTVLITTAASKGKKIIFDDLNEFVAEKDYIVGGTYKANLVSLSTDFDHTTGTGKSLKLDSRTKSDDRVKFLNMFSKDDLGKKFKVSAWVYSPSADAKNVSIAIHSDKGTEYAFAPLVHKVTDVKKGVWTQISVEYEHTNEIITQVGIDQRPASTETVTPLYIDDVEVVEEGASDDITTPATGLLPIKTIEPKEGRRPTPIAEDLGKGYDDLIFYDRVFKDKSPDENPNEIFKKLPEGRVIVNQEDLMKASVSGPQYGELKQVSVEGMPFKDAWSADVKEVPDQPYLYQLVLESLEEGKDFNAGDAMLLVFNMRTISTDAEDGNGLVQCIVEMEVAPNTKALQENVSTIAGQGWHTVYLPFVGRSGFTRLCVRLGYHVQNVEFGGYELINYEDKVEFDDLPTSSIMEVDDGRSLFDRDNEWRKDAWDRIEQIRKGDINVIVKDANGNLVKDAKVDVNMYDHEFMWGTAVNGNIIRQGESADKYRAGVSALFNTAVMESEHKWTVWEKNPDRTRQQVEAAKALNLKHIRGHTFIWDRSFPNGWTENSSVPEDLVELMNTDRAKMDERIRNYIHKMGGEYKGELVDWDVVNELLNNNAIRTKYGNEVLNDWFKWAREADPNAKLYINETGLLGTNKQREEQFRKVLDYMVNSNVDFDGIGIQGHFGDNIASPEAFYNMLNRFGEYGKEMKITEFDIGEFASSSDREYEASATRDILIAAFSQENMVGFLMWGFYSNSHWLKNAPIFDLDWELKESGRQFIDLVYNKWWTQESGVTGDDGKYSVRGYYGDYDITVDANGKTKTVSAQCYKGQDNTIVITLD